MAELLLVGLGGAIGAIMRYAISLCALRSDFPWLTLITNILGAFVIGILAGMQLHQGLSKSQSLFFKTGFCGGFTTFSTFSLESIQLLDEQHYGLAAAYIASSLFFCFLGVVFGRRLAQSIT